MSQKVSPKRRSDKINEARAEGMHVVFGNEGTLLIDVDSKAQLNLARKLISWAWRLLEITAVEQTRSKSGNWHLYVTFDREIPRTERVLIQGLLGGDPKRAILDWQWATQNADLDDLDVGSHAECFLIEVPKYRRRVLDDLAPSEFEDSGGGYI